MKTTDEVVAQRRQVAAQRRFYATAINQHLDRTARAREVVKLLKDVGLNDIGTLVYAAAISKYFRDGDRGLDYAAHVKRLLDAIGLGISAATHNRR